MREKRLVVVTCYESLRGALCARKEELHVAGQVLDEVAGLPENYVSKLLAHKPQRRIGWDSLLPLLGSLGCKLLLVDDPEARRRNKRRKIWQKRCEAQVRNAHEREMINGCHP
jgi:hypothetical protein